MPHLSDSEFEANASQVASEVLRHPASLNLAPVAVNTLMEIAGRHPPITTPRELRFLRAAVELVNAAELLAGQEVAQK